jgi:hypothetical protein
MIEISISVLVPIIVWCLTVLFLAISIVLLYWGIRDSELVTFILGIILAIITIFMILLIIGWIVIVP